MNIFILDGAQHLCAQYHSDVHLNSQLKEAVQILSTVYGGPYKPTHTQHPCVRWAAESHANAIWLYTLACELHTEWIHRFGKPHGSGLKLTNIKARMAAQAPRRFVTRSPFAPSHPGSFGSLRQNRKKTTDEDQNSHNPWWVCTSEASGEPCRSDL